MLHVQDISHGCYLERKLRRDSNVNRVGEPTRPNNFSAHSVQARHNGSLRRSQIRLARSNDSVARIAGGLAEILPGKRTLGKEYRQRRYLVGILPRRPLHSLFSRRHQRGRLWVALWLQRREPSDFIGSQNVALIGRDRLFPIRFPGYLQRAE